MSSIDIGGGVSQKEMRPSFQSDQPCSPHTPYASAVSWSIGAERSHQYLFYGRSSGSLHLVVV